MRILAIETSCDETAAAVVEQTPAADRPWMVRSNIVASQADLHREWGGVVPELASRQHVRDICGVVERAMDAAGVTSRDLGAIAVTQGPGLVGSLLVGVSFAKALAAAWQLPLVPVHHLAGHLESLFLQHGPLPLPAVVLVVSGGHTSLYEIRTPGQYRAIGRTRDDAAGEAFDKVAKLLGLAYPGGPVIDRLARTGNDRAVTFPVARMTHPDRNAPLQKGQWDFSFSGLKTAVLRHVRTQGLGWTPDAAEAADLCASFQRAVVEALVDKTFAAARWYGASAVGIAGGVSANSRLRAEAAAAGARAGLPVFLPALDLSTDNAAMIGAAGLRRFQAGVRADDDLNADASLKLPAGA